MLASPPIFTLGPRDSQVIRVGLKKPGGEDEAAYRVILEEIPQATSNSAGIRVSLRLNLPFYKQPKAKGASRVTWSLAPAKDGGVELRATNAGTLHEQINRVEVADATGTRKRLVEQPGVVLPASTKSWAIGKGRVQPGRPMKLIVVKPGGEEAAEALVQGQP